MDNRKTQLKINCYQKLQTKASIKPFINNIGYLIPVIGSDHENFLIIFVLKLKYICCLYEWVLHFIGIVADIVQTFHIFIGKWTYSISMEHSYKNNCLVNNNKQNKIVSFYMNNCFCYHVKTKNVGVSVILGVVINLVGPIFKSLGDAVRRCGRSFGAC